MPQQHLHAGPPDPSWYYESVPPSSWEPPQQDTCLELYRKAYCGRADVAFPILWLAGLTLLCWSQTMPLWAIVLVAIPLFIGGVHLFIIKGEWLII